MNHTEDTYVVKISPEAMLSLSLETVRLLFMSLTWHFENQHSGTGTKKMHETRPYHKKRPCENVLLRSGCMSRAGIEGYLTKNSLYSGLTIDIYSLWKEVPIHSALFRTACASATHAASSSRILLLSLNAPMLPTKFNDLLIGWENVNVELQMAWSSVNSKLCLTTEPLWNGLML